MLQTMNTYVTGIGKTTPVWMYPQGKSHPYGFYELAGNVWEWQGNRYGSNSNNRVLRGGSFNLYQLDARCAARLWVVPDFRLSYVGFRICLSPCDVLKL